MYFKLGALGIAKPIQTKVRTSGEFILSKCVLKLSIFVLLLKIPKQIFSFCFGSSPFYCLVKKLAPTFTWNCNLQWNCCWPEWSEWKACLQINHKVNVNRVKSGGQSRSSLFLWGKEYYLFSNRWAVSEGQNLKQVLHKMVPSKTIKHKNNSLKISCLTSRQPVEVCSLSAT